ncbi:MAG: hypothetical protein E7632_11400 [Ruminococcaceae bacterium]|nr:hypothetical protein [Oscillospiraceae bacterium]
MRKLCLRCHTPLSHIRTTSLLTRDVDPLLPISYVHENRVESFEVEIHCCPECGHIELFRHDTDVPQGGGIAQVRCPACGRSHDMDYPKCPFCKYDYNA